MNVAPCSVVQDEMDMGAANGRIECVRLLLEIARLEVLRLRRAWALTRCFVLRRAHYSWFCGERKLLRILLDQRDDRSGPPRDSGRRGSDIRRIISLDLIVLRRPIVALVLLPVPPAFVADLGFERIRVTAMACGAITVVVQLVQSSFDDGYKLRRFYGSVGVPRRDVADARWLEALVLFGAGALLIELLGLFVNDPVGASRAVVMLCWSAAVGVPVFLCLAPAYAMWVWEACTGAGIGALYGAAYLVRPFSTAPSASVGLAAAACAGFMIASRTVARYWYGRQDY